MGSILTCIVEITIGILLLINPVGFTVGIIMTLGVVLTITGISNIVGYFRVAPDHLHRCPVDLYCHLADRGGHLGYPDIYLWEKVI